MPTATPAAVRKQIEAGKPDPIYLLQGEDEIEKDALAHEFEELVEEDLRAFNVERLQAGDFTSGERLASGVAGLIAAARTVPMLSPRRVVLVLRAENVLTPKRESEAASRALESLEAYLQHPEPQTTLVFVASAVDKRGRLYKLLAKQATLVECGVIESQADAERWVRNRVAAAGMKIDPAASRLLAERAGTDIARLRNDVERALLYALGHASISVEDIREIAGPAALQDDWAMTRALETGDTAAALKQLALTMDAGVRPEVVLGQLAWFLRTKVTSAARLQKGIDAVFRTDLGLKGSGGDPRMLLERLVVELSGR